ncbi:MAG: hypothetical protein RL417_342, partial [Pseudomonadota bacterium]
MNDPPPLQAAERFHDRRMKLGAKAADLLIRPTRMNPVRHHDD